MTECFPFFIGHTNVKERNQHSASKQLQNYDFMMHSRSNLKKKTKQNMKRKKEKKNGYQIFDHLAR